MVKDPTNTCGPSMTKIATLGEGQEGNESTDDPEVVVTTLVDYIMSLTVSCCYHFPSKMAHFELSSTWFLRLSLNPGGLQQSIMPLNFFTITVVVIPSP
jgi:hypothetical protein